MLRASSTQEGALDSAFLRFQSDFAGRRYHLNLADDLAQGSPGAGYLGCRKGGLEIADESLPMTFKLRAQMGLLWRRQDGLGLEPFQLGF